MSRNTGNNNKQRVTPTSSNSEQQQQEQQHRTQPEPEGNSERPRRHHQHNEDSNQSHRRYHHQHHKSHRNGHHQTQQQQQHREPPTVPSAAAASDSKQHSSPIRSSSARHHEMKELVSPSKEKQQLLLQMSAATHTTPTSLQYPDTSDLQYQQQSLLADDLNSQQLYDEEIEAQERAIFMQGVESDVSMVHEMFLDLNSLVHQQGHTIDVLENSISATHQKTRAATDELIAAELYQRKKRQRMCCLTCSCGLLMLSVVMTLYIMWKL